MLYLPRFPHDASPKAISESASYLQVCLAFHSQPQLVPALFSGLRFGPPQGFTPASAWPRLDHLASGLPRATRALFGLGFPPAPGLPSPRLATHGNSQAHSTKGTPPRGRSPAATACGSVVSGSLSLPSRGPFHLSLTVLCSIGSHRVFSLGGWSPQLPAGFLVSRGTQAPAPRPRASLRVRGSHPLRPAFPDRSARMPPDRGKTPRRPCNPGRPKPPGLGSSAFARRYWRNLV